MIKAIDPGIDKERIVLPGILSKLFSGISSNYILETALDSPETAVDLSICILKKEASILVNHWQQEELNNLIRQNKNWEKPARFCALWTEPNSVMHSSISDVWFEFDHHQLEKDLAEACFFFSPIILHNRFNHDPRYLLLKKQQIDRLLDSTLSILLENDFPVKLKDNVTSCIEALPSNGAVFQVGAMLPRNSKGLRICTTMPVGDYPKYLENIGWKGDFTYLGQLLQAFKRFADAIFIDFDADEEIFPKIGIECGFRGSDPGSTKQKLEIFLSYLKEQHLCVEEKAESIFKWLDKPGGKRIISHLKIILDQDNSLKAKAYLAWQRS